MIGIPKEIGHIWIGPYEPPMEWMNTWRETHPEYKYSLYGNKFLQEYPFRTRALINEYSRRRSFAGVSDLMRYEILYEFGGVIPEADSRCYHNTTELWSKSCPYTVYENEFVRGKLVSPILAAPPKNEFVKQLIDELCKLEPADLEDAWISTGNLFVAQMIEKYQPDIVIYPSHYFIPVHYTGIVYKGYDKVYAKQMFGSTRKIYKKTQLTLQDRLVLLKFKIAKNILKTHRKHRCKKRVDLFNLDFNKNDDKLDS